MLLWSSLGNWSALSGDAVKFGLGIITMVFDSLLLLQHYVVYKKPAKAEVSSAAPVDLPDAS
jgi:cystinosin